MMNTPPLFEADEDAIAHEKNKGRLLRTSSWWKQKCAQGVCSYCGNKVAPSEITMDHVVPLIRGGRSVHGNLVPACKPCNNKKRAQLLMDWEDFSTD
ncbi:MAG: HNH endonuclease [Nitrospirae bacterium]|nr:HNH endonuclease [Candidatus Troglogloeales bacterium]